MRCAASMHSSSGATSSGPPGRRRMRWSVITTSTTYSLEPHVQKTAYKSDDFTHIAGQRTDVSAR